MNTNRMELPAMTKEKLLRYEAIQTLRKEARDYRDTNNAWVQKFWALEQEILKTNDAHTKKRLTKEKDTLLHQIETADYPKKIASLVKKIIAKEIALQGYSDLDSNSPYEL